MTIYTKCEKCKKWVEESSMDYFTEIGNVCQHCSFILRNNSQKEVENRDAIESITSREANTISSNPIMPSDTHSQIKKEIDKNYTISANDICNYCKHERKEHNRAGCCYSNEYHEVCPCKKFVFEKENGNEKE